MDGDYLSYDGENTEFNTYAVATDLGLTMSNSSSTNITNNSTVFPDQYNAFETFTKLMYAYGIPIISLFGILGNILSFKVFVFTSFGSHSSSTYIGALSLSDTGFLASLLLTWLGHGRIGLRYSHTAVFCHVMIFVTYVCSFLSVWYVVLIMIDRYIVVCHSLRVTDWCNKRRARIATAGITMFGVLFYGHTFFTAEVVGDNCNVRFILKFLSIFVYVDTAVTFIIPFAIIFLLNIVVILSIRRFQVRHVLIKTDRTRDMASINILSKAQFRITKTFTLVSIVLLVTNLPSHGIRLYISYFKDQIMNQDNTSLMYAQHVFQIIYYFNFAVNFLLYSVSSDRFRKYLSYKYFCHYLYKRFRKGNNDHLYR